MRHPDYVLWQARVSVRDAPGTRRLQAKQLILLCVRWQATHEQQTSTRHKLLALMSQECHRLAAPVVMTRSRCPFAAASAAIWLTRPTTRRLRPLARHDRWKPWCTAGRRKNQFRRFSLSSCAVKGASQNCAVTKSHREDGSTGMFVPIGTSLPSFLCKRSEPNSATDAPFDMLMAPSDHLKVCEDVRPAAGPAEGQDAGRLVPRQQDLQQWTQVASEQQDLESRARVRSGSVWEREGQGPMTGLGSRVRVQMGSDL